MQNLINTLQARLWPANSFVSPFSLEESITRLRSRQGIYSGVDVKVRLNVMDTDRVQFQVSAHQEGWDGVKMELAGRLHRQGETTQVLIHPAQVNERRLYLAAFMIMALILFAAMNGGFMAVVIFGSAFSASWLFTSRKEDELTRLVREALAGQQPG